MRHPARIPLRFFGMLALPGMAAAWFGCAEAATPPETTTGTGGSSLTLSAGTGGSGTTGSGAAITVGSGGGSGGGEVCTSTSEKAEPVPLDLVFLIDRSMSMQGPKWTGTTSALSEFFDDPVSAGISAGMVFFPTLDPVGASPWGAACDPAYYKVLDVPIAPLPENAFNLKNTMPANSTGGSTPTYAGLHGALQAAVAYQDAHPTHKVAVVLATDGDPWGCDGVTNPLIANLAKIARDYNGVLTYVIGVEGSNIPNLNQIALAGGTTAAYDITTDITKFSATMAEIRAAALACEFALPPPPMGKELVPDEVNFTYTPAGGDVEVTLPRADDLFDCGDEPGWYYDDNLAPTKILVCPASCASIQNDAQAEVAVAFGCKSVLN